MLAARDYPDETDQYYSSVKAYSDTSVVGRGSLIGRDLIFVHTTEYYPGLSGKREECYGRTYRPRDSTFIYSSVLCTLYRT